MCTAVYCVLSAVYYLLRTVYCVLCTVYCVLCTVYYLMCTICCVLGTGYCILYSLLCTICCVLGLARNIGHGLHAFVYEPFQGAMESPKDLIIGIGVGTTSLFQGVVTGALNSTSAFVETAGTG